MAEALHDQCLLLLRQAAERRGGEIYRQIELGGRRYSGLHLVWDSPDRIIIFAFCYSPDRLAQTQSDLTAFLTALSYVGIYKKLHLILFHAPDAGLLPEKWPVGLSVNAFPWRIAEEYHRLHPPLVRKLQSLLLIETAPHHFPVATSLQEWRHFLTAARLNRRIAELGGDERMTEDLALLTWNLLEQSRTGEAPLDERLTEYLGAWKEAEA